MPVRRKTAEDQERPRQAWRRIGAFLVEALAVVGATMSGYHAQNGVPEPRNEREPK